MTPDELRARTGQFALNVIRVTEALPRTRACDVMARQLVRCGTSVGANYRAACRATSQADFIAKMGIVEEEADESIYWLELLVDAVFLSADLASPLIGEANEILSITVASIKTARTRGS
jgi:four helix bundle protein